MCVAKTSLWLAGLTVVGCSVVTWADLPGMGDSPGACFTVPQAVPQQPAPAAQVPVAVSIAIPPSSGESPGNNFSQTQDRLALTPRPVHTATATAAIPDFGQSPGANLNSDVPLPSVPHEVTAGTGEE